jgi:hypothetical protein
VLVVGPEFSKKRGIFFAQVFGRHEGYLCLARKNPHTKELREQYFSYPTQLEDALNWIDEYVPNHDLYFCAQLLTEKRRKKEFIKEVALLWADLDPCPPEKLKVAPSVVLTTSDGRSQAIWRLEEAIDAFDAEDFSRRIAYWHKADGVDQSGWDLTQLLRVPFTFNFKYPAPHPTVDITSVKLGYYRVEDFAAYHPIPGATTVKQNGSVPHIGATGAEILERNRFRLPDFVYRLFTQEPDESQKEGWSGALWALIMECAQAGLEINDIFAVAKDAACNKYARDGRPEEALWKEVQKAWGRVRASSEALAAIIQPPATLIDADYKRPDSFIERYISWAKEQTDAAEIYHQAGAFMVLSACLSPMIVLPTRDRREGERLNLWFFILANTTITRKTTAMRMALKLVREVYPDAVAATEATIEGLFATMATRSGKPSIFLRDEFSGMLDMMVRKDYYSGMQELLTQLYDGYEQERKLANKTITIKDPILLMFVGGAKDKILELLTPDHSSSGFLPRFLFFSSNSDMSNYRPLGPPTEESDETRDHLSQELQEIVSKYQVTWRPPFGSSLLPPEQKIWKASLTPEAWERYSELDRTATKDGVNSREPFLITPMYQRLAKSILKAAVLLAAARPDNPDGNQRVMVHVGDIEHAISYGTGWRDSALEVVTSAGATSYESMVKRVLTVVHQNKSNGIARSALMRMFTMQAREADGLFATLEGRNEIRKVKQGDQWLIFPAGG